MNHHPGSRSRGDNTRMMKRQTHGEEEEINRIPAFHNSDLIEKFKLTMIGSIGKALGTYDTADVERSRVKVFVNGDLPLKFDCKIGFANGDVVKVSIQYEDLYIHCFSCKRISHEEGTCPEINNEQKERNRLERIYQQEKEERETREAFSIPQRKRMGVYTDSHIKENRGLILTAEMSGKKKKTHMISESIFQRDGTLILRMYGIGLKVPPTRSFPEIGRDIICINTAPGENLEKKREILPLRLNGGLRIHMGMGTRDKQKSSGTGIKT
ncbi:hypothetical protein F2Q69_00061618 [Brassica cretica]|uniref:Zinc knuckle CX2CX4HX4C domain-containing protein n=1 Tax=Brassica cretica TaxID=69181 RepID=A0A8S9RMG6_BRACR|nr:hypothetical protein F2Q69_00061618 [Brassica cretica]